MFLMLANIQHLKNLVIKAALLKIEILLKNQKKYRYRILISFIVN
jgi:hypothetical protein